MEIIILLLLFQLWFAMQTNTWCTAQRRGMGGVFTEIVKEH